MNFLRTKGIVVAVCALLLAACSTPKEIVYFQDLPATDTVLSVIAPTEIKVMPKDKLSIIVTAQQPRLTNLFNLPYMSKQIGMEGTSGNTSNGILCYTVDSKGNIDFPVLGTLHVAGMTREQIAAYVKQELMSRDQVKDPVVTVEFVNFTVSVMGEVNHPGRFSIDKDKVTILDALSQAGDLTIYGKREKVMVMRSEGEKQSVYRINLCSGNSVYNSPAYYLKQGDVVYVEPNDTRARQSTVNGNNVRSTSFWISLASLLTSVTVLIVK